MKEPKRYAVYLQYVRLHRPEVRACGPAELVARYLRETRDLGSLDLFFVCDPDAENYEEYEGAVSAREWLDEYEAAAAT